MNWVGLRTTSDGKIGGPAAYLDAGVIMALAMPGDMHHAGAVRVRKGLCGTGASYSAGPRRLGFTWHVLRAHGPSRTLMARHNPHPPKSTAMVATVLAIRDPPYLRWA